MHTFVHLMINQRRRTMLMAALILVSGGALFYYQINVTQSFPPNGKHSARKEPLGPSHTPLRLNIYAGPFKPTRHMDYANPAECTKTNHSDFEEALKIVPKSNERHEIYYNLPRI